MFLSVVATLGAILSIACAIPQLIVTFKQGNTIGFSTFGLCLKGAAALLMTVYAVGLPLPIFVISVQLYNDLLVFAQLYYCFFPRKK